MDDIKFGHKLQDLMQDLDWSWTNKEKRDAVIAEIYELTGNYLKKENENAKK